MIGLADVGAGVSAGVEATVGDPFVVRRGLRVAGQVAVGEWVEVGVSLSAYPALGEGGCDDPDWTELSCQLLSPNGIYPDFPEMVWQAQPLTLRVVPLREDLGAVRTDVGVLGGLSLIRTRDDIAVVDIGEVEPVGTTHPAWVAGAFGDVRGDHVGLRLRVELDGYLRPDPEPLLHLDHHTLVGAEIMWWPR